MDFILLVLLIVVIILQVLNLLKKDDDKDIVERLGKLEKNVSNDLADFKFDINKYLMNDFDKLNEKIEQKLNILKKQEEKNENIINEKLEELQNQKNKVAKLYSRRGHSQFLKILSILRLSSIFAFLYSAITNSF